MRLGLLLAIWALVWMVPAGFMPASASIAPDIEVQAHGNGSVGMKETTWLRLPQTGVEREFTSFQVAKRGIKIGKILDFFRGEKREGLRNSDRADGTTSGGAGLARVLRGIGIRGLLIYGLLFLTPVLLLVAAIRFIRLLLRGMFLSVRDAEIVDARLTQEGKYRPIVAFEDKAGQLQHAFANFETRKDPRGDWAAAELSGKTVRIVKSRRSFAGCIGYVLTPIVLSAAVLFAAYYLDTAV